MCMRRGAGLNGRLTYGLTTLLCATLGCAGVQASLLEDALHIRASANAVIPNMFAVDVTRRGAGAAACAIVDFLDGLVHAHAVGDPCIVAGRYVSAAPCPVLPPHTWRACVRHMRPHPWRSQRSSRYHWSLLDCDGDSCARGD